MVKYCAQFVTPPSHITCVLTKAACVQTCKMLSTFNSQCSLPLRTNYVLQLFTHRGISPFWAFHSVSMWMCTQIERHLQSAPHCVMPLLRLAFAWLLPAARSHGCSGSQVALAADLVIPLPTVIFSVTTTAIAGIF